MSLAGCSGTAPAKRNAKSRSKHSKDGREAINELLSSCAEEILNFERDAAREAMASQNLLRMLRSRANASTGKGATTTAPCQPVDCLESLALIGNMDPEREVSKHIYEPSIAGRQAEKHLAASSGREAEEKPVENLDVHAKVATDVTTPAGPIVDATQAGSSGNICATSSECCASLTSGLLEILAHDNTVMECNLQDYEAALSSAIQESIQLKTEVTQMAKVCDSVNQLQDLVAKEMQVHANLREENIFLMEKHHELISVLKRAAETDCDDASAALIDELVSENSMLRILLFFPDAAVLHQEHQLHMLSSATRATVKAACDNQHVTNSTNQT